jgi:rfaE bifunctional protein nucleotidyltransferase chain/domain
VAVYSIDELAELIGRHKAEGQSVGLCHGCFDILHIGHIRHFAAARGYCDLLFVSVTGDQFVNKGPNRPVIPEQERAEVVSSLKSVAGAMINQSETVVDTLRRLKPSMFFKGQEYQHSTDPRFLHEKSAAEEAGIEVKHTYEKVYSSSKIIYAIQKPTAEEVRRALDGSST